MSGNDKEVSIEYLINILGEEKLNALLEVLRSVAEGSESVKEKLQNAQDSIRGNASGFTELGKTLSQVASQFTDTSASISQEAAATAESMNRAHNLMIAGYQRNAAQYKEMYSVMRKERDDFNAESWKKAEEMFPQAAATLEYGAKKDTYRAGMTGNVAWDAWQPRDDAQKAREDALSAVINEFQKDLPMAGLTELADEQRSYYKDSKNFYAQLKENTSGSKFRSFFGTINSDEDKSIADWNEQNTRRKERLANQSWTSPYNHSLIADALAETSQAYERQRLEQGQRRSSYLAREEYKRGGFMGPTYAEFSRWNEAKEEPVKYEVKPSGAFVGPLDKQTTQINAFKESFGQLKESIVNSNPVTQKLSNSLKMNALNAKTADDKLSAFGKKYGFLGFIASFVIGRIADQINGFARTIFDFGTGLLSTDKATQSMIDNIVKVAMGGGDMVDEYAQKAIDGWQKWYKAAKLGEAELGKISIIMMDVFAGAARGITVGLTKIADALHSIKPETMEKIIATVQYVFQVIGEAFGDIAIQVIDMFTNHQDEIKNLANFVAEFFKGFYEVMIGLAGFLSYIGQFKDLANWAGKAFAAIVLIGQALSIVGTVANLASMFGVGSLVKSTGALGLAAGAAAGPVGVLAALLAGMGGGAGTGAIAGGGMAGGYAMFGAGAGATPVAAAAGLTGLAAVLASIAAAVIGGALAILVIRIGNEIRKLLGFPEDGKQPTKYGMTPEEARKKSEEAAKNDPFIAWLQGLSDTLRSWAGMPPIKSTPSTEGTSTDTSYDFGNGINAPGIKSDAPAGSSSWTPWGGSSPFSFTGAGYVGPSWDEISAKANATQPVSTIAPAQPSTINFETHFEIANFNANSLGDATTLSTAWGTNIVEQMRKRGVLI